eukprot:m.10316 g.10316  ORF g.10316 m.10316 type:complete len:459 (-) comp3750_c0_seq2:22-1398(-)
MACEWFRAVCGTRAWLLCSLLAVVAAGGTILEPHEGSHLWTALDTTLHPDLILALRKEAIVVRDAQAGQLKFGKLSTNWYPTVDGKPGSPFPKPRFAAEQAIHYLRELDFPGNSFAERKIVGAEWWFQLRDTTENIGFHYDKDEGVASIEMRMSYPAMSTITYLSDTGSPTLIFNQTTPDGNSNVPLLPEVAALFYPQMSKHVTFAGNLMHGVVGELGKTHPGHEPSGVRGTFLVNWWTTTPRPPNTRVPPKNVVASLIKQSQDVVGVPRGTATPATMHSFESFGHDTSQSVVVVLPPADRLHVALPKRIDPTLSSLNFRFDWPAEQVSGGGAVLDLNNEQMVRFIFQSHKPKVLVFHRDATDLDRWELPILKALRPRIGEIHLYFADIALASDAMQAFGVSQHNLPTVCIHDTSVEAKYKLRPGTAFSEHAVRNFVNEFFRGVLDDWDGTPDNREEL